MKVTEGHIITTLTIRKAVQKEAFFKYQKKARKHHTKADLEKLWEQCVEKAALKAEKVFRAALEEREATAKAVAEWGQESSTQPLSDNQLQESTKSPVSES